MRELVRADAGDPRAQRVEEAAEPLHVRLAGRVQDDGGAQGDRGRHHRVLGGGDAHLVEEDLGAPEAAIEGEAQREPRLDPGPQRAEGEQVGVDAPPSDPVAAGSGQRDPAGPGEQARRQQHRAAELGHHGRIGVAGLEPARVEPHRARLLHGDAHAQVAQPFEQRGHVADARDVVDDHLAPREQAGGEDGQRLVLVAGRGDRPAQGMAALHQEAVAGHRDVLTADHHNRPDFFAGSAKTGKVSVSPAGPRRPVYHLAA